MEAISKAATDLPDEFDFWSSIPTLKDPFLKYCKAFQPRLSIVLRDSRIIPEVEDDPTSVKIKGIILDWKKRQAMSKQTTSEMTVETQFLDADKKLYKELSQEFANISFCPKSREALENTKALIMLELKILLGSDIAWSKPVGAAAPGIVSSSVLDSGGGNNDANESSESDSADEHKVASKLTVPRAAAATPARPAEQAAKETAAGIEAAAATAEVTAARADAAADATVKATAATAATLTTTATLTAEAAEAAAAAAAAAVVGSSLETNAGESTLEDFTTWTPDTWTLLDYSKVSFPPDKPVIQNKIYYALAMIFCNSTLLRSKHKECYKGLCSAWEAHFGIQLSSETLGNPPSVGPYAYTQEEQEWCTQTLRMFNAGASAPPIRLRIHPSAGAETPEREADTAEPRRSRRVSAPPAKPVVSKAQEKSFSHSKAKIPQGSGSNAGGEGGSAVQR